MPKIAGAFSAAECVEYSGDTTEDLFFGSGVELSQQSFELGEELLDWVQIGRIGRQEQQPGADAGNGEFNGIAFVAAKVVDYDNIAGSEGGYQRLLDISARLDAVHWTIKQHRRIDTIQSQCGQERERPPFPKWRPRHESFAAWSPTPNWGHVRLDPGLVNEHKAPRIEPVLHAPPLATAKRNISPSLLGGVQRFF
jgi:hypothetical protein